MPLRLAALVLLAALAACKPAPTFSADEAKRLLRATGCTNCHDTERPLVGPPFAAVAARYAGQPTAEAVLAQSLANGSQGKWGRMAMPSQKRLEPAERDAMLRWILALQPRAAPAAE